MQKQRIISVLSSHRLTLLAIYTTFVTLHYTASCPPGFQPPSCQHECQQGRYGLGCASTCPSTCFTPECHPTDGHCFRCRLGFRGRHCNSRCRRGEFGQDCARNCGENCQGKVCDSFTGACAACLPGFLGTRCDIVDLSRSVTGSEPRGKQNQGDGTLEDVVGVEATLELDEELKQARIDTKREKQKIKEAEEEIKTFFAVIIFTLATLPICLVGACLYYIRGRIKGVYQRMLSKRQWKRSKSELLNRNKQNMKQTKYDDTSRQPFILKDSGNHHYSYSGSNDPKRPLTVRESRIYQTSTEMPQPRPAKSLQQNTGTCVIEVHHNNDAATPPEYTAQSASSTWEEDFNSTVPIGSQNQRTGEFYVKPLNCWRYIMQFLFKNRNTDGKNASRKIKQPNNFKDSHFSRMISNSGAQTENNLFIPRTTCGVKSSVSQTVKETFTPRTTETGTTCMSTFTAEQSPPEQTRMVDKCCGPDNALRYSNTDEYCHINNDIEISNTFTPTLSGVHAISPHRKNHKNMNTQTVQLNLDHVKSSRTTPTEKSRYFPEDMCLVASRPNTHIEQNTVMYDCTKYKNTSTDTRSVSPKNDPSYCKQVCEMGVQTPEHDLSYETEPEAYGEYFMEVETHQREPNQRHLTPTQASSSSSNLPSTETEESSEQSLQDVCKLHHGVMKSVNNRITKAFKRVFTGYRKSRSLSPFRKETQAKRMREIYQHEMKTNELKKYSSQQLQENNVKYNPAGVTNMQGEIDGNDLPSHIFQFSVRSPHSNPVHTDHRVENTPYEEQRRPCNYRDIRRAKSWSPPRVNRSADYFNVPTQLKQTPQRFDNEPFYRRRRSNACRYYADDDRRYSPSELQANREFQLNNFQTSRHHMITNAPTQRFGKEPASNEKLSHVTISPFIGQRRSRSYSPNRSTLMTSEFKRDQYDTNTRRISFPSPPKTNGECSFYEENLREIKKPSTLKQKLSNTLYKIIYPRRRCRSLSPLKLSKSPLFKATENNYLHDITRQGLYPLHCKMLSCVDGDSHNRPVEKAGRIPMKDIKTFVRDNNPSPVSFKRTFPNTGLRELATDENFTQRTPPLEANIIHTSVSPATDDHQLPHPYDLDTATESSTHDSIHLVSPAETPHPEDNAILNYGQPFLSSGAEECCRTLNHIYSHHKPTPTFSQSISPVADDSDETETSTKEITPKHESDATTNKTTPDTTSTDEKMRDSASNPESSKDSSANSEQSSSTNKSKVSNTDKSSITHSGSKSQKYKITKAERAARNTQNNERTETTANNTKATRSSKARHTHSEMESLKYSEKENVSKNLALVEQSIDLLDSVQTKKNRSALKQADGTKPQTETPEISRCRSPQQNSSVDPYYRVPLVPSDDNTSPMCNPSLTYEYFPKEEGTIQLLANTKDQNSRRQPYPEQNKDPWMVNTQSCKQAMLPPSPNIYVPFYDNEQFYGDRFVLKETDSRQTYQTAPRDYGTMPHPDYFNMEPSIHNGVIEINDNDQLFVHQYGRFNKDSYVRTKQDQHVMFNDALVPSYTMTPPPEPAVYTIRHPDVDFHQSPNYPIHQIPHIDRCYGIDAINQQAVSSDEFTLTIQNGFGAYVPKHWTTDSGHTQSPKKSTALNQEYVGAATIQSSSRVNNHESKECKTTNQPLVNKFHEEHEKTNQIYSTKPNLNTGVANVAIGYKYVASGEDSQIVAQPRDSPSVCEVQTLRLATMNKGKHKKTNEIKDHVSSTWSQRSNQDKLNGPSSNTKTFQTQLVKHKTKLKNPTHEKVTPNGQENPGEVRKKKLKKTNDLQSNEEYPVPTLLAMSIEQSNTKSNTEPPSTSRDGEVDRQCSYDHRETVYEAVETIAQSDGKYKQLGETKESRKDIFTPRKKLPKTDEKCVSHSDTSNLVTKTQGQGKEKNNMRSLDTTSGVTTLVTTPKPNSEGFDPHSTSNSEGVAKLPGNQSQSQTENIQSSTLKDCSSTDKSSGKTLKQNNGTQNSSGKTKHKQEVNPKSIDINRISSDHGKTQTINTCSKHIVEKHRSVHSRSRHNMEEFKSIHETESERFYDALEPDFEPKWVNPRRRNDRSSESHHKALNSRQTHTDRTTLKKIGPIKRTRIKSPKQRPSGLRFASDIACALSVHQRDTKPTSKQIHSDNRFKTVLQFAPAGDANKGDEHKRQTISRTLTGAACNGSVSKSAAERTTCSPMLKVRDKTVHKRRQTKLNSGKEVTSLRFATGK